LSYRFIFWFFVIK